MLERSTSNRVNFIICTRVHKYNFPIAIHFVIFCRKHSDRVTWKLRVRRERKTQSLSSVVSVGLPYTRIILYEFKMVAWNYLN